MIPGQIHIRIQFYISIHWAKGFLVMPESGYNMTVRVASLDKDNDNSDIII